MGKAYITPTVNALNDYVAEKATLAADPDAVVTKLVTNRTDTPEAAKMPSLTVIPPRVPSIVLRTRYPRTITLA